MEKWDDALKICFNIYMTFINLLFVLIIKVEIIFYAVKIKTILEK